MRTSSICRSLNGSTRWRARIITPSGSSSRNNGTPIEGETISYYAIVEASAADAGSYDCVVTSACGNVTTRAADLRVCIGDFDCDGAVTVADFEAFMVAFQMQDPSADVNGDGVVDQADAALFMQAYESGC